LSRFFNALAVFTQGLPLPATRSAWLIPLLIVLLMQIAGAQLVHDLVVEKTHEQQATARAQIEDDPQMSAEQKEMALERMEKLSGGVLSGST